VVPDENELLAAESNGDQSLSLDGLSSFIKQHLTKAHAIQPVVSGHHTGARDDVCTRKNLLLGPQLQGTPLSLVSLR